MSANATKDSLANTAFQSANSILVHMVPHVLLPTTHTDTVVFVTDCIRDSTAKTGYRKHVQPIGGATRYVDRATVTSLKATTAIATRPLANVPVRQIHSNHQDQMFASSATVTLRDRTPRDVTD